MKIEKVWVLESFSTGWNGCFTSRVEKVFRSENSAVIWGEDEYGCKLIQSPSGHPPNSIVFIGWDGEEKARIRPISIR